MSTPKTAAAIIKNAREEKDLTQLQLAEKAGVHPNTVAKIERGEQKPSFPTLKKLSKVLGFDIGKIPE